MSVAGDIDAKAAAQNNSMSGNGKGRAANSGLEIVERSIDLIAQSCKGLPVRGLVTLRSLEYNSVLMGSLVAASAMTNTPFGLPFEEHMPGAVGFLDLCQALPALWLRGGGINAMMKCATTARTPLINSA